MLDQITCQKEGFQYFKADKGKFISLNTHAHVVVYVLHIGVGMRVALLVNNLGGTSNLELLIMANAAIRYLGKV